MNLAPARLLALAEGRDLWLDDSPCVACAIGSAVESLAEAVHMAESLRGAGRRPGALRLASEASPVPSRQVPVLDAAAPPVARRALFTGLADRLRAGMADAPSVLESAPPARAGRSLPAERLRLLALLSGWPAAGEAAPAVFGPDLATVSVDVAACSACGLCDRACPTGALRFNASEGAFQLDGLVAACVACQLCVRMCPEDAIMLLPEVALEELIAPRERSLAQGALTSCAACGTDVASRADGQSALCHSCRMTGGPTRHGHDTAGLMDDLLRHAGLGIVGAVAAVGAGAEVGRRDSR